MSKKIGVSILGATGPVGQRFISLLADHPFFEIEAIFASQKSAGKRYEEAVNWIIDTPLPASVAGMVIRSLNEQVPTKIVFSALPSDVAGNIELQLRSAGKYVFTNSSSNRMRPDVPIIVPEVNPEHLRVIEGKGGFIVANPNCTTAGLVIPLKAIQNTFGIKKVLVISMQALSGAGFPGVPSLSIFDNLLPHIKNEEDKVKRESKKILGKFEDGSFKNAEFIVDARCNRVAVRDGHTEVVFVESEGKFEIEEIKEVFRNFKGMPQKFNLPTAPEDPIVVAEDPLRPQPILDRNNGKGMAITVGNIRKDEIFGLTFTLVSHNTIRGAAGGSILNAELALKLGYMKDL